MHPRTGGSAKISASGYREGKKKPRRLPGRVGSKVDYLRPQLSSAPIKIPAAAATPTLHHGLRRT